MYPHVGADLMAASRRAIGLGGGAAPPRPPRPPRPAARPVGAVAGAAGCGGVVERAASNGARSASVGQRNSVISSADPVIAAPVNTARRFSAGDSLPVAAARP